MKISKNILTIFAVLTFLLLQLLIPHPVNAQDTLWIDQFGTEALDYGRVVKVDNGGNYYIAGPTHGSFPGFTNFGGTDGYIRKYDSNQNVLWTRQFGTNKNDSVSEAAVDNLGGVYTLGGIHVSDAPVVREDIVLRKFDSINGELLWTHQFGSGRVDAGYGVVTDALGNIYVTGSVEGSLDGNIHYGDRDFFVRKYSQNGSIIWTRQFGSSSRDSFEDIFIDNNGFIYLAGGSSGIFPSQVYSGGGDAVVAKLDSNGNLIWLRQFGTYQSDSSNDIIIHNNSLYVSGITFGIFPNQVITEGYIDSYLRKYDLDGNELWTKQFGAGPPEGTVRASDMGYDQMGNVYLIGNAYPDFDGQTTQDGLGGSFIKKFNSEGNALWTRLIGSENGYNISSISSLIIRDIDQIIIAGNVTGSLPGKTNFGGFDAFLAVAYPSNSLPISNAGIDQTVNEGQQVVFNGSGSTDPDGIADIVSYQWDFGDGGTASGQIVNHIYADNGVYTATLTVTDTAGAADSDTVIITVNNVAPIINAGAGAIINEGGNFMSSGSFTDPGILDTQTATVDYGDGTGILPLSLSGNNFDLNHAYQDNGTYSVTVEITDDDLELGTDTIVITVNNVSPTAALSISPQTILQGESSNLSFSNQYDPSISDILAGFSYSYDCSNDGLFELTDSLSTSFSCSYQNSGNYIVNGRIKDKDGGYTDYTLALTVQTPAQATDDLSDLVETFNLQQGISNSLDAKLDAVLNALDDLNINNDAAAINSLQAFINAVEAQRGNKITNEQADALISAANAIISSLQSLP